MSREIDPGKIAAGTLDEDEMKYLHDRNQLPQHMQADYDKLLAERNPTAFDWQNFVGQILQNAPAFDGNRPLSESAIEYVRSLEKQTQGLESVGTSEQVEQLTARVAELEAQLESEAEVDESDDYEEGWNNDTRRAELAKRGLDDTGSKQELIARLLADDASR